MAPIARKITQNLFATAEHVAPTLAGKVAFALFCRTADPRRLSAREAALVGQAGAFMAQARRHRLTSEHGHVTAYEFNRWNARRDGPAALVLHGWRSRTEHMRHLVEALLARGMRVVALDLPGHGRSGGRRLHLPNGVAAVHAASLWLGPFAAVVGHSFGGAVALNAMAGSVRGVPPVGAGRLAMIAAPNAMPRLFDDFGDYAGLGPRTRRALAHRVERMTGRPLADFVGTRQLAGLDVPALVVHAPDDKEVPAYNARAFGTAGDHVHVVWMPGLGHRRILADAAAVERVAAFAAGGPAPRRAAAPEKARETARP